MNQREQFETWAVNKVWDADKDETAGFERSVALPGRYCNNRLDDMWDAYQAGAVSRDAYIERLRAQAQHETDCLEAAKEEIEALKLDFRGYMTLCNEQTAEPRDEPVKNATQIPEREKA